MLLDKQWRISGAAVPAAFSFAARLAEIGTGAARSSGRGPLRTRHGEPWRPIVLQVLNLKSRDLTHASASDRADLDQEPERAIDRVGGPDQLKHLIVGEDDVARLAGVRQSRKADPPRVAVGDALVAIGRQR